MSATHQNLAGSRRSSPPGDLPRNAREAQKFGQWLHENFGEIKVRAEATDPFRKPTYIDPYAVGNMLYCRFNYVTGDATGQNMVGKATFAACEWINDEYPGIRQYLLSGNIDSDKKSSFTNTLRTRGKRVIAEVTIPGALITKMSSMPPSELLRQVSRHDKYGRNGG